MIFALISISVDSWDAEGKSNLYHVLSIRHSQNMLTRKASDKNSSSNFLFSTSKIMFHTIKNHAYYGAGWAIATMFKSAEFLKISTFSHLSPSRFQIFSEKLILLYIFQLGVFLIPCSACQSKWLSVSAKKFSISNSTNLLDNLITYMYILVKIMKFI